MVNMNVSIAYEKAKQLNHRDFELEKIIATNAQYSYWYASDIIKERWEEGEKIIAKDIYYSFFYAQHVIKGPFHLCHPIIFNSSYKKDYILFLKSINYDLNEISEWLI